MHPFYQMFRFRRLVAAAMMTLLFSVAGLAGSGISAAQSDMQRETITIAYLGDSITAGYGLNPGEAYPDLLEVLLKEKGLAVETINAGVSGDTTAGGLSRLDWSIPDTVDAVVVALGGNDALRGIPVEKTRANLDAILTRLKERGVAIILAGMLSPPNMGPDYETAFNAIYPSLAETHDVIFYPFILDGVAAEPDLNQDDAIHPNAEGNAVLAQRLLPSIEALIEKANGKEES